MTTCQQCTKPLAPADESACRCSHCGHSWVSLPPVKPATVADVRIDQTMEFADGAEQEVGPLPSMSPKSGTVAEVRIDQTMDFADGAEPTTPPLPPFAQKTGTVADVRIDQTMDFDSGPASPPADAADFSLSDSPDEPKTGTVHEREQMRTMDFGSAPPPPADDFLKPNPGKATDHDNFNLLVTHGSGHNDSDLVSVLSIAWGDELQSQVSPRFTLKGKEAKSDRTDQTLVVNARAVRDAREPVGPAKLADYELLDVLGEGGMGVVYAARQASIDRTVAIKMLKPKMSGNKDLQQKFLSEAVVTGDLDHPNIVPMYDLGKNEAGALFYAMKRVQGTPWSKAIAAKSQFENIDILLKAADAVAFAHARGVVHRDLKPENIMLGEFGEVLVMDWGLAYSTPSFRKSGSISQTHSMGGSPAYMAPEMAMGPIERITAASDIYLLGAILYEIITGKPPHTGANVSQCLTNAARNEIIPTEKTGELVDIARRAMASQPADRYPTVQAFQTAIRDYLAHNESIALSSRSEGELAKARADRDYREFARALFGFEEALKLWDGNRQARDGAQAARTAYAECAFEKGDFDLAAGLLDAADESHADLKTRIEAARRERDARQQRLRRAKRIAAALVVVLFAVGAIAFFGIRIQRDRAQEAELQAKNDRDRAVVAEGQARDDRDRAVTAEVQARADRDRAEESKLAAEKAKEAEEYEAYVARIGLAAAKIEESAFDGALQLLAECPEKLRDWEWGRLKYLCERARHTYEVKSPVTSVAHDVAGARFANGSADGGVQIRNVNDGKVLVSPRYGGGKVNAVAFSPDGKLLAVGGNDRAAFAQLFDAVSGEPLRAFAGHAAEVVSLAFNHDGKYLLTTSTDASARIWEVAGGKLVGLMDGHIGPVWSAAWSPDGKTIVTGGDDGSALVWDVGQVLAKNGAPWEAAVTAFMAHKKPIYAVAFSPLGEFVATGGDVRHENDPQGDHDGVLVWKPGDVKQYDLSVVLSERPPAEPPFQKLAGHTASVRTIAYSPDAGRIASGGLDNTIVVHESSGKSLKTLRGHAGHVRACRFLGDGPLLLSGGFDETIKVWDIDAYSESDAFAPLSLAGAQSHTDAVLAADISGDERTIVTAGNDRTAKLWNLETRAMSATLDEGHHYLASFALFTPDGSRLITAAADGTAAIWDARAVTQTKLLGDVSRSAAAAVSPNGRLLALAQSKAEDKVVEGKPAADRYFAAIYDVETGDLLRELPAHRTEITALAFSPDGAMLFTGEASGRANVWRTADAAAVWSEKHHAEGITAAAFTADGARVLTASLDFVVGVSDAATGREYQTDVLKHPNCVLSLAMLGAGRAATACEDGAVRIWTLGEAPRHEVVPFAAGQIRFVVASRDGRLLAAIDQQNSTVRMWSVAEQRELHAAPNDPADRPWADVKRAGGLAWAAAFAPDGESLVVVGDKEARRLNTADAAETQVFKPHGAVAGVAFSPDDKHVATAGDDGSVRIWNVAERRTVQKLVGGHLGGINSVVYSADGTRLLTAGDDRTARLWDAETGAPLRAFTGHAGRVTHAAFSPDGRRIVTSSDDKSARIFDAESGNLMREIVAHKREVLWAEFDAEGKRIVTAGADDEAIVWNVADGKLAARLAGHTSRVTSAAFSHDGRRIVTGSQDGSAKIWDATTAQEMLTLKGHAQEVTGVRFSKSDRAILTSGRDHIAVVWPAAEWEPSPKDKP